MDEGTLLSDLSTWRTGFNRPNLFDEIPLGDTAVLYIVLSVAFHEVGQTARQEFREAFEDQVARWNEDRAYTNLSPAFDDLVSFVRLVLNGFDT